MTRIYGRIGFAPEVIGVEGDLRTGIAVGLWNFTEAARRGMSERSGVPEVLVAHWFDEAFAPAPVPAAVAA